MSESNKKSTIEAFYDNKGNASHYNSDRLNTIIKMERIWGTEAVMTHCEITAFKYRERIGKKSTQSIEQELLKATWYETAAKYFFEKLSTNTDIIKPLANIKHDLPWKS